jgi:hypothetical protein
MTIKINKIVLAAAAAGIALSLTTSNTFASADASAVVVDDGNATSYTYDNDNLSFDNCNFGELENFDMGAGNSGFNKQSWNDDENDMTTGNADGWASSDNFLNSTIGSIEDADDETAHASATVGEDGDATANASDNDEITVRLHNRGELFNVTVGVANSGMNKQSHNDDGNLIETGDADAMAGALNEVNSSWLVLGGNDGGAHALAEVGDDGNANAMAQDNDSLHLSVRNSAGVDTMSMALANTGMNKQSHNDDDNVLTTGGAQASSYQETYVNSTVVNTEINGGGAVASATVGEDGNATSNANDNDSTSVSVSNNAEVSSASVAVGNTGGNSQSGNDDGNSMSTGDASGATCSTQTVNTFWFGNVESGEGSHGCN